MTALDTLVAIDTNSIPIHKININGKEIKSIGSQMLYSMGERK